MDEKWKQHFLEAMRRRDITEEQEFLSLVDQVEGNCPLDVARVLMKSFSDTPDFGTQERVVSQLASAEKSDAITAILDELPRLLVEAREWAAVLVGQEVDRRPELLVQLARQSSPDVRQALLTLLAEDDFTDFYPNAKSLMI